MGKRSRKRRPSADASTAHPSTDAAPTTDGAPTTNGSAAPTRTLTPPGPSAAVATDASGEPLSKAERKNAELRASLEPLGAGERPTAVSVAAIVALLLAVANIAIMLSGYKVKGAGASPAGAVVFAGVMLVAAWGMWRVRYWAVLGFQALVAVVVVIAALSLMVASGWQGALLCVAIIGLGGWLFWKLVRAMARIQMPKYERG